MGTPFPRYYRDETSITISNTTSVNSTTQSSTAFRRPIYRPIKENAFIKKRRLESKQQKRDRVSLDVQMKNRFQFNELKPRIKTIVTKPKFA